jgi:membrane protease YdiL (CAAX protease family)
MTALSSVSRAERYKAFPVERPIMVCLVFFLIVVVFRVVDLFVIKLEEFPDKSIFSRVFGFLAVLGFLYLLRKPISAIGLHARNFGKAFLIGMLSLAILYALLYGFQFYRLDAAGQMPQLVFGAINSETAALGGLLFTLIYLFGQVCNALMEESIFRGVMLPHFMRRFSFWKANALQASLFALAHLVFPLSSWLSGEATAVEAGIQAVSLLVLTFIGGLVFGYLYYRTNSLWTAVLAHFTDNVIGLFFHIQTVSRINAETDILMLGSIGFISLTILVWFVSKRSRLPTLKPWGA